MPDIPVGSQIFDLVFHPTDTTVYTSLLDGHIKAFRYDEQGQYQQTFSIRPSKRSCRSLATNQDGSRLHGAGKAKSIFAIDTSTGDVFDTRKDAHDLPINRTKHLLPNMFCTGDDDGVIKLWDPRQLQEIRQYVHHFDFISDFLWLENKRQLISTSGDGTLSVIDVRGRKTEPLAQSEDQEDELLSVVTIRNGSKVVVGTQLGILSIFNATHGWGDCVDRVPGHPQSIDALCGLPSAYPSSHSTILTGSSDGLMRVVQLFPTKLLGVVADHGSFPIERIAIDQNGEGRWIGSAGHEDVLKMTDLREVFEDEDSNRDHESNEGESGSIDRPNMPADAVEGGALSDAEGRGNESGESEEPKEKKRKRKGQKDTLAAKKKKGRNEIDADPSFFAGL
ncbi:WD40-repeat-containing domain protein [Pisolithus orientalis]|uniref:WD40-repeat-containing domain protein n=1 Tax=Pisolithus orientalis TaxID=936130 RepID=UPI0022255432|nr:WD40-repeat-containing domain protein [Pisolithus orientalis]KAI6015196.1 WD40-repeat-containing domain protein [Pisolithus orientalis]